MHWSATVSVLRRWRLFSFEVTIQRQKWACGFKKAPGLVSARHPRTRRCPFRIRHVSSRGDSPDLVQKKMKGAKKVPSAQQPLIDYHRGSIAIRRGWTEHWTAIWDCIAWVEKEAVECGDDERDRC